MAERGAPIGNSNAKKAKRFEGAITRALAKIGDGKGVEGGIDKLATQLVDAAAKGEQWALIEVANRLDGKPAQAIIGGDDDSPPIKFTEVLIRAIDGRSTEESQ